jgi:hypothetical protein
MNSNLPAGAENDPNQPWDTSEKYCRVCESESIGDLVDNYLAEHPDCGDWDEAYEKLEEDEQIGLCRHCYWEENHGWDNED